MGGWYFNVWRERYSRGKDFHPYWGAVSAVLIIRVRRLIYFAMSTIKTYIAGLGRTVRTVLLALAVIFVGAGLSQAATTISTNISTDGTLGVTGLSSLGQASSTMLSANRAYFGSTATSTFSTAGVLTLIAALAQGSGGTATTTSFYGGILYSDGSAYRQASSTALLQWEPTAQLFTTNNASTTNLSVLTKASFGSTATSSFNAAGALTLKGDLTLQNDEVISNSTNGVVSIGGASDVVKILGTASTSALKVGDEPAAPTINGMVFGYCSFANVTSFTASTTKYVDCTTTPTDALLATDRVFVQATSSFDSPFLIQAASSTGVSTINLRVLNTGFDGAEDTTLGGTSINFWAVR